MLTGSLAFFWPCRLSFYNCAMMLGACSSVFIVTWLWPWINGLGTGMFTRICHHSRCPILMPISGQTDTHTERKYRTCHLHSTLSLKMSKSVNVWFTISGTNQRIFGCIVSTAGDTRVWDPQFLQMEIKELLWSKVRILFLYIYSLSYRTYHLDNHLFPELSWKSRSLNLVSQGNVDGLHVGSY